jgi:hypothetical protein
MERPGNVIAQARPIASAAPNTASVVVFGEDVCAV